MGADHLQHESVASPLLAGRKRELSVLEEVFDDVTGGQARVVLIAAEAGGGKSRLIREFAGRIPDRGLVLIGACLEQTDGGLPYAPFNATLRQLVRERGIAAVSALAGTSGAADLARLLPAFGVPSKSADPEIARARLFEVFQHLAERLAAERPLVWVIEDVHWADGATRDLLTFLARNLDSSPVLFIVSYRTDELGPQHAVRPFLAELCRGDGVVAMTLPRLSRREVADQLEGILGHPPMPAMVTAIHERGAGVPLFTEALVNADGTLRPALPGSLRDLLLTAVHELPEETQRLLRFAAVWGTRIEHDLLSAVSGQEHDALNAALRTATAAHVLVSDDAGYAFRHALIREVVHGDVLAGERSLIHRRFAEVLEQTPRLAGETAVARTLARHWAGAHDYPRALRAAWSAAELAERSLAYSERLDMLELTLDLWDRVPDASLQTGSDAVGVVELAADAACWAVESERGLALVERALDALSGRDEPSRTAAMLLQRAVMRQQRLLPGQLEDLRDALHLLPAPTRLRAETLAQLCRALMLYERPSEARPFADELATLAGQLDDEEHAIESRITLAQLAARDGDEAVASLRESLDAARRAARGRLEVLAYVGLLDAFDARGAHRHAIATGQEAWSRVRQVGQARYMGATIAQFLSRALTSVGEWDEAVGVVEQALALDPGPFGRTQLLASSGEIAIARGELPAARRILDELRSLAGGPQAARSRELTLARLELDYRFAVGDWNPTLDDVTGLAGRVRGIDPRHAWPLLTTALRAVIEAGGAAELRSALSDIASDLATPGAVERAHAALFDAEMARAERRGEGADWDAVAEAWSTLGQPYPRAYALLRSAAAWMSRDRDGASARLHQANEIAAALGAAPLLASIADLASRARIDRPTGERQPAAEGAPALTARELEVLHLVAKGCSNREIGAELFISVKTASVHVSNILAKLKVPTRAAAAAAAHRLNLIDQGRKK